MTQGDGVTPDIGAEVPQDRESEEPTGPVIRDKRRLDPETGKVREPKAADAAAGATEQEVLAEGDDAFGGAVGDALPGETQAGEAQAGEAQAGEAQAGNPEADVQSSPEAQLAADRLEDLRRLQAEYVNYKRRVDRDRALDKDVATGAVVEALLPVLDDLHMAKEHGELDGPLVAVADKLEATLGRFGVERLGEVGEAFDPTVHEALMHLPEADLPEGATATTIVQVMQPGFRIKERVVRAARVAVADPT